jgi:hypothetical protein
MRFHLFCRLKFSQRSRLVMNWGAFLAGVESFLKKGKGELERYSIHDQAITGYPLLNPWKAISYQ